MDSKEMPAGAEARLGIADLPGEAGVLCAGGLYAVEVESASTRFDLIIQTLRVNIGLGIGCALLTPIPPGEWIARLRENRDDDLIEYLRTGRLLLLSMVGDYGKNIFRFGAEGFSEEIERCGVSDGFTLIIDRADSLFSLHDVTLAARQSGVYRQWCRAHRISALLFFLSRPETSCTVIFRAMLDYFSGHARLRGIGSERAVEFDYWRGTSGQAAALRLALRTDAEGILRVDDALVGSTAATVGASQNQRAAAATLAGREDPAEDEDDLITTDEYLAAARPPLAQGEWHHVRSFAGLLEVAAVITSATVVLDFTPTTPLAELAEKVFALRQAMSERAKIVVREHAASLRFSGTALLFKLGVNAVISGTTSAARIGLLVRSLRGRTVQTDLEIPIDDAIASAVPPDLQGIVDAYTFAAHVRDALTRAQTLALPCLLVTFLPVEGADPTMLADRLNLGRRGDIATADETRVAIFLFACDAEDLASTLERIAADCADVCSAIDLVLSEPEHMEWFIQNELLMDDGALEGAAEAVRSANFMAREPAVEHIVEHMAALFAPGTELRKLVAKQEAPAPHQGRVRE